MYLRSHLEWVHCFASTIFPLPAPADTCKTNSRMTPAPENPRRPLERFGFTGLSLLTLSPVVLHGIWRPLAQRLHTDGDASVLTFAALGVSVAGLLVQVLTWNHRDHAKRQPVVVAGAVAVFFGMLSGAGFARIAAAVTALLVVALFGAVFVPWMMSRLPIDLDGLAKRRKVTAALVVLLGIATITQSGRISTYMGDHKRPDMSLLPDIPFIVNHSCLTAYVEAARLATVGEKNIYDAENWPDLTHSVRSATYARRYAPFALDAFAYPPPFLLLPRVLLLLSNDFQTQRAIWFAINGVVLTFGLWAVAKWIGGKEQIRPLLLAPLVVISIPTILTLQIGNVHAAVLVLAMLAMVAFESNRPALGGAMLAFAIVSKISPGLLVIVLLFQRRFREVFWTAGFGVAFVLVSLAIFGTAPFEAFVVYQMPLLSSGKALSFLAQSDSIAFNLGPFGIPFKLDFLGMKMGDPWVMAKHVNQVFTAVVVFLTLILARRSDNPQDRAVSWLIVLTLGTLRSPYAPGYVTFPVFWLLSLWAIDIRNAQGTILLAMVWLLLSFTPPMPLERVVVYSFVQQGVLLGLLFYLPRRAGRRRRPIELS